LVELLGVEFDASLDCEEVDHGAHELDAILLLVDVVRDIALRVVLLRQPVEDVGHQLEVGTGEVLEGDDAAVVQRTQHLAQGSALAIGHLSNLNK
jgi:hypothetical protein